MGILTGVYLGFSGSLHPVGSRWRRHSIGPPDSRRSCTSAKGRIPMVEERPVCDSRYGNLHAGKLPFIRDGARFALTLAGLGMSLLEEGRRAVT